MATFTGPCLVVLLQLFGLSQVFYGGLFSKSGKECQSFSVWVVEHIFHINPLQAIRLSSGIAVAPPSCEGAVLPDFWCQASACFWALGFVLV